MSWAASGFLQLCFGTDNGLALLYLLLPINTFILAFL